MAAWAAVQAPSCQAPSATGDWCGQRGVTTLAFCGKEREEKTWFTTICICLSGCQDLLQPAVSLRRPCILLVYSRTLIYAVHPRLCRLQTAAKGATCQHSCTLRIRSHACQRVLPSHHAARRSLLFVNPMQQAQCGPYMAGHSTSSGSLGSGLHLVRQAPSDIHNRVKGGTHGQPCYIRQGSA